MRIAKQRKLTSNIEDLNIDEFDLSEPKVDPLNNIYQMMTSN